MFSEQSEEKLLIKSLLCRFIYILKTSCISVGPKNPIFSSCISTAVKTERVWGKRTQWRNVAILQRPCTQVSTEHRQVGCSTWCIVPKPASVKMTVEPSSGDLWRKSDLHARLQGVCVCVSGRLSMFSQTNEALICLRVGDKDGMLRSGGMGLRVTRMLFDAMVVMVLDVSLSSTFTCFNIPTAPCITGEYILPLRYTVWTKT